VTAPPKLRSAETAGTTNVLNISERFDASLTEGGRYRLLIDAITDYAIFMLDASGHVTSWNSGAQRVKGYTAADILGQHFSMFYTEEDRRDGVPQQALETAARTGKFEGEGWRLRKDGSRFRASVVIDPIRDHGGRLVGYAKVTRDLDERKAAGDALRQSEQQFRLLVQSVTDYAIYTINPAGEVSTWNAGAERIKGFRAEEIIGRNFALFYTQEDRQAERPRQALEQAARDGRFTSEGWRVRKDGSRFWASVVIDPIRGTAGQIIGFAKVSRDVTESRRTQQAMEQAREALFQSQKMESIGQLTGGVAHDFNNILMAVIGGLELVRGRLPEDPRTTPLLDNALDAARRGTALTERMLTFARRQKLNPKPVEVLDLVRGIGGLLQRSLGPLIEIETCFAMPLRPVFVDAHHLELALLNLALNARDAMPSGGPLVIAAHEVTVGPDHASNLAPGCYVCLSVTDRGEGMDEEALARAVEPFFTTKEVGKGTGLGLSMVHGMAEQSGGRLILKSRKNEGTTAELWLPTA
jgi:PAS domain S-box-containing protein